MYVCNVYVYIYIYINKRYFLKLNLIFVLYFFFGILSFGAGVSATDDIDELGRPCFTFLGFTLSVRYN